MKNDQTDSRRTAAKKKTPCKVALLTVTISGSLCDRVASFLGDDIVNDPAFWNIALRTGVEELERQYREIEAECEKEAEEGGYTVIFGSPVVIDTDDIPF